MHRSLNPSNFYGISARRQVVFEVVEAYSHQFVLGEPLQAFKSETSPSNNEVGDFLSPSLSLVSISCGTPTRLFVLQTVGEILVPRLAS